MAWSGTKLGYWRIKQDVRVIPHHARRILFCCSFPFYLSSSEGCIDVTSTMTSSAAKFRTFDPNSINW